MGLVSQVFDETALNALHGAHRRRAHAATPPPGHRPGRTRSRRSAPPRPAPWPSATTATSPTPPSCVELVAERYGSQRRGELARGNTTDTALVTALLAGDPDHTLEAAALEVLPQLRGAFSLVFMDEHTLYAARDPQGVRPLVLGRLERGWVVASETAGAGHRRRLVRPRDRAGRAHRDRRGRPALAAVRRRPTAPGCVFEYVYLARPDTTIAGRSCTRRASRWAGTLAREHPVEADLVIPVPESGTPAAVGYAAESGIPFGQGLVKNAYVGRTFIQPSQTIRQLGIRLKLNPLREVIRGKRLVVVDDSIVRGNTQRALDPDAARGRRGRGARAHQLPPVKWPCFYGIDFASRAELIANGLSASRRSRRRSAPTPSATSPWRA